MITYHKGDLIANVKTGLIVHGCNAQGKMASGFAKQLRATYPDVYDDYLDFLASFPKGKHAMGHLFYTHPTGHSALQIVSAITQEFYGKDGKRYVEYDAMKDAMYKLEILMRIEGYANVHMPKIGAGLGGGDWEVIEDIIDVHLSDKQVCVWEL